MSGPEGQAKIKSPNMEAPMVAIMCTAVGTAVCSPPRPADGAMLPAATHWTNPSSAEPVPSAGD